MKTGKLISLLAAGAMLVSMCAMDTSADEAVIITSAKQLMSVKGDGEYYLGADIDLTDVKWKPINGFSGIFDGNGHEIRGLTSDTYGLFSTLGSGAIIRNVRLEDAYITSKYGYAGGIAAIIQADAENVTIVDCFVSGVVAACNTRYHSEYQTKNSTAGAIAAVNNSDSSVIINCSSNAIVASERIVGGLVGVNRGTLRTSGFFGELTSAYNNYDLGSDIKTGMKQEDYRYLYVNGGLCGINYGNISDSFSNCSEISEATYYGGIAGALQGNGSITECVNSSLVRNDPFSEFSGGLIAGTATSKTSVSGCYTKYPTEETVQSDIGKSAVESLTYGVKEAQYGNIDSFNGLESYMWGISDGVPVLKDISKYTKEEPYWVFGSYGHLKRNPIKIKEYGPLEPLRKSAEEKLRKDFYKYNSGKWKDVSADDMVIRYYYGTYNGCEVVVIYPDGYGETDDENSYFLNGYKIVLPSGSLELLLHKDSTFIDIYTAYSEGLLSDDDLAEMFYRQSSGECRYN